MKLIIIVAFVDRCCNCFDSFQTLEILSYLLPQHFVKCFVPFEDLSVQHKALIENLLFNCYNFWLFHFCILSRKYRNERNNRYIQKTNSKFNNIRTGIVLIRLLNLFLLYDTLYLHFFEFVQHIPLP